MLTGGKKTKHEFDALCTSASDGSHFLGFVLEGKQALPNHHRASVEPVCSVSRRCSYFHRETFYF